MIRKFRTPALVAAALLAAPALAVTAQEAGLDLTFDDAGLVGVVDFKNGVEGESVADGMYTGTLTGTDPQLRLFTTDGMPTADDDSNALRFDPADYQGLEITMQVDSDVTGPRKFTVVFYSADPDGDFATANPKGPTAVSKGISLEPSGTMGTYVIKFDWIDFSKFADGVEGIRIDPIDGKVANGAKLMLDRIRLVPRGEA